jgi:hypothetical protein
MTNSVPNRSDRERGVSEWVSAFVRGPQELTDLRTWARRKVQKLDGTEVDEEEVDEEEVGEEEVGEDEGYTEGDLNKILGGYEAELLGALIKYEQEGLDWAWEVEAVARDTRAQEEEGDRALEEDKRIALAGEQREADAYTIQASLEKNGSCRRQYRKVVEPI